MKFGRLALFVAVAVLFTQECGGASGRLYQSLTLKNGMRVLLVSDRRTSRAAASIDVGIGSWSDPASIPGLAHFLEHMLFLGTRKYPSEGEYRRYLSRHAGSQNAYTIYENTNFYFAVSANYLANTLDRFAQFFIAPTLEKSASQREMKAVDSEFRKRINSDFLRSRQVLMTMVNPHHPYHRFTTGNLDTLNVSGIHSSLVKFHEEFYSSNLMTLVVLGRESLDRLQQLVVQSFSEVKNKHLERPTFKEEAFPVPEYTGIKVLLESLGAENTVYLYWPLPSLDKFHRENPIYYFAWLLGHEGSGSILSVLKRRQWATSIYAGSGLQTTSLWLMQIRLYLTGKGLAHLDDVISLVFQYIRFILKGGILKRIYDEQHQLLLLNYHYQPKTSPYSFAKIISRNMQTIHNPKDYRMPPSRSIFDANLIRSILKLLTPERLLLFVSSPQFKNPNSAWPKLDKVEKWYGTRYHKQKLTSAVIKRWANDVISREFNIPSVNPYVPRHLEVLPRPHCHHSAIRSYFSKLQTCISRLHPSLIFARQGIELWWKRELNFLTPKIFLNILLGSPNLSQSAETAAAGLLFRHLLLSHINNKLYPAKLAGFDVAVSTPLSGVMIQLNGYSYHSGVLNLLRTVIAGMKTYESRTRNAAWFNSSRHRTAKGIAEFGPTAQVFKHLQGYYESLILSKTYFRREDLAAAMEALSGEEVRQTMRGTLRELHLTMLVYGNANQPEVEQYARDVLGQLRNLNAKPVRSRKAVPRQRHLLIPPGKGVLFRVNGPNKEDVNSGVNVIYQIGPSCGSDDQCGGQKSQCQLSNVVDFVLSRVVAYFMKAACFSQLRTKEQLGYVVFCYPFKSNGIASVHFVIQSNRYGPHYLFGRVKKFVSSFMRTLRKKVFDRRQWKRAISHGASSAMSNGRSMPKRNKAFWKRIAAGSCKFQRSYSARTAYFLLRGRPSKALQFYNKFFINKSTRKLLAIELYGKGRKLSTEGGGGEQVVTEQTIKQFKHEASYYPSHTD